MKYNVCTASAARFGMRTLQRTIVPQIRRPVHVYSVVFVPSLLFCVLAGFGCMAFITGSSLYIRAGQTAALTSVLKPVAANVAAATKAAPAAPANQPPISLNVQANSQPAATPSTQAENTAPNGNKTACTVFSGYAMPTNVDLAAHSGGGLNVVKDKPALYKISAPNLTALRQTIDGCSRQQPGLESGFHASTGYRINWQYDITNTGAVCKLENVRVGVHINQIMPELDAVPGQTAEVSDKWNAYRTNLIAHEAGHVELSTEYAERLIKALQNLPPIPCDAIQNQATALTQSYTTLLAAKHAVYDSKTAHGVTQGATL